MNSLVERILDASRRSHRPGFPKNAEQCWRVSLNFFSHLYGLPTPAWIEKPEYFLPEAEYFTILTPESEAGLYRMRARTPKELLRRNVVFEGRNMTLL